MKLTFEPFDGRSFNDRNIHDADSKDRMVGFIASGRQTPGIHIFLVRWQVYRNGPLL